MASFEDKQQYIIYTALKDVVLGTIKLDSISISSCALQWRGQPRLQRSFPPPLIIFPNWKILPQDGEMGWTSRVVRDHMKSSRSRCFGSIKLHTSTYSPACWRWCSSLSTALHSCQVLTWFFSLRFCSQFCTGGAREDRGTHCDASTTPRASPHSTWPGAPLPPSCFLTACFVWFFPALHIWVISHGNDLSDILALTSLLEPRLPSLMHTAESSLDGFSLHHTLLKEILFFALNLQIKSLADPLLICSKTTSFYTCTMTAEV